jgi:hypothetical protein
MLGQDLRSLGQFGNQRRKLPAPLNHQLRVRVEQVKELRLVGHQARKHRVTASNKTETFYQLRPIRTGSRHLLECFTAPMDARQRAAQT